MFEWPLIPAGIAVLLGSTFVLLGLRAPRRGQDRYCRRCGYNLAGLASQRCPECGSDLAARRAVVTGRRSIRIKPLVAGLFLLLIGAPLLVGAATHAITAADLWTWAPTELLFRSASAGDGPARTEAVRRLQLGQLDAASASRLLESAAPVVLSLRKKVVCDEFHPVALIVNQWPELINGQFLVMAEVIAIRIDGQIQRVDPLENLRQRQLLVFETPGEHAVELDVRVISHKSQTVCYRTLKTSVQAVPPAEIDDVELVRSADLDEHFADGIDIEFLNLAAVHDDAWWFGARLHIVPPVDLALRVEAEHQNRRIWIGDVTFQTRPPRIGHWLRTSPRRTIEQAFGVLPEKCDLIFRGDKRAARATSNLIRVWGGEARVKDVKLSDSLWGR